MAKIKAHTPFRKFKRALTMLLVVAMLLPYFVMPASAVTLQNKSLQNAINAIIGADDPTTYAELDLSGTDIVGGINGVELKAAFPDLQYVDISNTNITRVIANGINFTSTDTFHANTRKLIQKPGAESVFKASVGGDLPVKSLLDQLEILTAEGNRIPMPADMIEEISVVRASTTTETSTITMTDIVGEVFKPVDSIPEALLKDQLAGTYKIELDVKTRDHINLGTIRAEVTLKIMIEQYALTPPNVNMYEGGSAEFTLIYRTEDGDLRDLGSKDKYVVYKTDIIDGIRKPVSEDQYTMDSRNEKMIITIKSAEVNLHSTTRIEVCLRTDDANPIGRATVSKVPNAPVNSFELREYSYDRGTNILAPNSYVKDGDKLNFLGGTSLASVNKNNLLAGGTYTRTTKFLVGNHAPQVGTDPNFVEPLSIRYLSQMNVTLGNDISGNPVDFSYNFSVETIRIEGKEREVIILTITATTPNARDYNYSSSVPGSTYPITVWIDNGNNSKAEIKLNAQIHTNEPKGYKVYSLPSYYESFTKNEVEDIINEAGRTNPNPAKLDEKVIEVAHYRKNSLGTDYESVGGAPKGATVYEGGNILLIAAAYYEGNGEDGQTALSIVPAPQTRGWYPMPFDPSHAFQSTPENIGTTDMVAVVRNSASMTLKGVNVLDVSLAAGITNKQETKIVYAVEGGFGNFEFPITTAESEVIEYVIAPKPYNISTGFTDIYHDLQAQIRGITKVTRNSLYNINSEQQDTIPIGTTKTYEIYEVRNTYKSNLVAVTGSLKDEISSTDDTYFSLVESASPNTSFVLEATNDGGKDDEYIGRGTQITYKGANGKKCPVVDIRLSESLLTGIFVVYEDLFGNYYSSAQELVDGSAGSGDDQIESIISIPSKHFEIPAGTEGAKAYNVYSFTNKKMYQDGNWRKYLVAAKYMDTPVVGGTALEQPAAPAGSGGEPVKLTTLTNLGSYDIDGTYKISTRAFDPSMQPADQGGIHTSNDPLENTFVEFANGRIYDLGSAVKNAQFTSPEDNIRVIKPIIKGMVVTKYDKVTDTDVEFIIDGTAPQDFGVIPGDTLETRPWFLLSAQVTTTTKPLAIFDKMKEVDGSYLGTITPDYDALDDSIVINRQAAPKGDPWTFIFAKQSTGSKVQYRYNYEVNGKWNYDSRLPAISENLAQTADARGLSMINTGDATYKASPYSFSLEVGKPKIWDVFMVAGDGLSMYEAPNTIDKALYTKPFRLNDADKSMRFYPVIVNSGIHANALMEDLRNTTKTMPTDKDITPAFIEKYPAYANYMFTNDFTPTFRGTTDASAEIGTNGKIWDHVEINPDNGDQQVIINKTRIKSFADEGVGGKVYIRVDLLDEIYAVERLKATIKDRFPDFDTALSTADFTAAGLAKYDITDADVPAVTTGHDAYFQHLDDIEHARVVDMKATIVGAGPYKVGQPVPIKVEYAISSDINPTQGITTNYSASTFNRPGVDVLPGYPNYPTVGTPDDYNVLRYKEASGKSIGAQQVSAPGSNSIWYALPNEAGEFVLQLTTINIEGALAPLFGDRYHEVRFTVEPRPYEMDLAFGDNKSIADEAGISAVDHMFKEIVPPGRTAVLSPEELREGKATMIDNVSRNDANGTDSVKVEIYETKNGEERFLYEMTINCYTSMLKRLSLDPATTASRPKELRIGETISLQWIGEFESTLLDSNGTPLQITVRENIDPTTWTGLKSAAGGELKLSGSTVTLTKAAQSGNVVYKTTHPGLKAHPNMDETVYFYVKAIADETITYDYTFYTNPADIAGSTVTSLELDKDVKQTVYVSATKNGTAMTGADADVNTAFTNIEGKEGTKAVRIQGTNSFEVVGFKPGVSDEVTVTLMGGGEAKLPIKVKGDAATFTLSGIVRNPSGAGVPGATVALNNGMSIVSGADGSYSFSVVAGTYTLTCNASGYEPWSKSVTVNADAVQDIELTVVVNPTYIISGKVTGSDTKAAIDGATVTLTAPGVSVTKTTDSNGEYSFTNLENGNYTIKIEADDYNDDTQTVAISGANATHDVELTAVVYSLTGKVVEFGTGTGLANVTIEINGQTLTTDSNGEYQISINSGSYQVKATLATYEDFTGTILVDANAGTIGDIVMIKVGTIRHIVSGNITDKDDNSAVAGAIVEFQKSGTTNLAYSEETDVNGNYTIKLLPDTYDVTVSKAGYQNETEAGLVISGDKNDNDYEIEKIKVDVSGKVIVAGGTTPLSGATVTLTDAASGSTIGSSLTTGASGEYKFEGIVAGAYIVKATAANHTANQSATINVGVTNVTVADIALTYVSPGGNNGGNSGNGNSGTPAKTYTVTLADIENGTATVNRKSASSGTNMTITLTPVKGYELDWITVRDSDGKDIDVTKGRNDRTYTFKMPASNVTVTVKYKVEGSDGTTPEPGPTPTPTPTPTPGTNPSDNFTDLIPSEWYIEYTDYVLSKGYMNGTSATTFEPGAQLTRGMMVQLLYNIEGKPSYTAGNAFGDVPSSAWYYDAVMWAASNKIVTGHDATRFAPDDSITREQMAAIIYRYSTYKNYDTTATSDLSGLAGTDKISDYAMDAIKWAVGAELMNGRNIAGSANIAPTETSTRAEVATLITRYSREFIDTAEAE